MEIAISAEVGHIWMMDILQLRLSAEVRAFIDEDFRVGGYGSDGLDGCIHVKSAEHFLGEVISKEVDVSIVCPMDGAKGC